MVEAHEQLLSIQYIDTFTFLFYKKDPLAAVPNYLEYKTISYCTHTNTQIHRQKHRQTDRQTTKFRFVGSVGELFNANCYLCNCNCSCDTCCSLAVTLVSPVLALMYKNI